MRRLALLCLVLAGCASSPERLLTPEQEAADRSHIERVLDDLHHAAAVADGDLYWSLYADDAVFIGTDATERWTLPEFRAFADRYFERDSAWVFSATERFVHLSPAGDTAWFYEKLDSKSYGVARGSGALVRDGSKWKISHYVLSFPIPNDIAGDVMKQVQAAN